MGYKILRKLTIISLVILALPFFQTCSNKSIMDNRFLKNSPLLEAMSPPVTDIAGKEIDCSEVKEFHYTSKELADKKRETIIRFLLVKNEITNNGYQLGFLFIQGLEIKDFFNSIDYGFLPFFVTLIITSLLIYFSFKRKAKVILILVVLNILLLITYLIMFYCSGFLEDIDQVKFGYYLFMINLFLIGIESYKITRIDKSEKKL